MKVNFKHFITFGILLVLLQSCGGADIPYVAGGKATGSTNPGGSSPPPGGGAGAEGCAVNFQGDLVIHTKLNPGEPGTNANGVLESEHKPLPKIIFHFSGNKVTLFGDEFDVARFTLGTTPVEIRQKAGTKAEGSYDASTGSITLNNLQFAMLAPLAKDFPPFNFTTASTGAITGDTGSLNEDGKPLAQDGSLELVGGFIIPPGIPDYSGKTLTVRFIGKLDKVPDPQACVGGAGAGVALKEVVKDQEGKEQEIALGSDNTLSMGAVFIPEKGVDPENSSTLPFKKSKVLRIQNNSSSPIAATFSNSAQFSFSPSSVNIAPDKSQDVTITFSTASKLYTPSDPSPTQEVSANLAIADKSLKLAGLLKRAGSELAIDIGDTTSPGAIDFGIAPVKMTGTGSNSHIACQSNAPSVLGRTLQIKNTGIRPLQIPQLPAPVMDDSSDTQSDPFCPSFGSKFQRMSLSISPSGATCATQTINGHTYLLDNCVIPPGNGYLKFKAVYIPKNAKSFITNTKDTAKLTIPSNDPVYKSQPFSLGLQAAVSKDTSDLLSLSKVKNGIIQSFKARNRERTSLNAENAQNNKISQVYVLQNESSDILQNVKISFFEQGDKDHFLLCKVKADRSVDEASCAFSNPDMISQIPAMLDKESGKAFFAIQFIGPAQNLAGPFSQSITVNYVPSSTPGAINEFKVALGATVGYKPLQGNVQMEVEFLGSFIDYEQLPNPRDSADFRAFPHVKSGPIRLILSKPSQASNEGSDTEEDSLMEVTIQTPVDTVDFSTMPLSERKKIVRLPSDSIMSCAGGNCKESDLNTCQDPNILPAHYIEDQNYCSYFYYVLKNGALKGRYNNETGEMVVPGITLDLYNPFHSGKTLSSYPENYKTKTVLKVTLTTSLLNIAYSNGIDYIPAGADRVTSIGIDSHFVNGFSKPCPANWDPTKDYDPAHPSLSPTPTFSCFLGERSSSSAPAYVKGLAAAPAPHGERSIALSFVTRFNDSPVNPEYIPFFMNDQTMWVVFQGRLKQCKQDWSDCPI